jgi:hypothetical protein
MAASGSGEFAVAAAVLAVAVLALAAATAPPGRRNKAADRGAACAAGAAALAAGALAAAALAAGGRRGGPGVVGGGCAFSAPAAAGLALGGAAALAAAWELGWYWRRRGLRASAFRRAEAEARRLGRPLVVVGAPDGGVTAGYGCGDVTVDIFPSKACPNPLVADVTKPLPFADDSVVVFVSCVLEYVGNADDAIRELCRVSGGRFFVVRVEPWTFASVLYPGAQRSFRRAPACGAPDG